MIIIRYALFKVIDFQTAWSCDWHMNGRLKIVRIGDVSLQEANEQVRKWRLMYNNQAEVNLIPHTCIKRKFRIYPPPSLWPGSP